MSDNTNINASDGEGEGPSATPGEGMTPTEQASTQQMQGCKCSHDTTTTTTANTTSTSCGGPARFGGKKSKLRLGRATSTVAAVAGCGVIIAAVIAGGIVSNRATQQQSSAIPFKPSALKVTATRRVSATRAPSAAKTGVVAGASTGMNHPTQVMAAVIKPATPEKTEKQGTTTTEHSTAKTAVASTVSTESKPRPKTERSEKSDKTETASKSSKESSTSTKTVALATRTSAKTTTTSSEPTTRPSRSAGEIYLILGSYPSKADAEAAQDRLTHDGVKCTIESALPGWSGKRHSWFSLVSTDGFARTHKSADYDRVIKSLHALKLDPFPYRWRDANGATGNKGTSSVEAVATIKEGA